MHAPVVVIEVTQPPQPRASGSWMQVADFKIIQANRDERQLLADDRDEGIFIRLMEEMPAVGQRLTLRRTTPGTYGRYEEAS